MPIVELNGQARAVSRAFGSSRPCAHCGERFVVTNITGRQFYCSESCKERQLWLRERERPDLVQRARERCAQWAARNRGCRRRQPWLLGAPPFGKYLPGGALTLRLNRSYELRHAWVVHGIMTSLTGSHHPNIPEFSLIPTRTSSTGWGAYVRDEQRALCIAGRVHECHLQGEPAVVECGPMVRFKAPRVARRGRRRLRIDAITPVCVRKDNNLVVYTAPTASNMHSTLASWLPRRLGLELRGEDVCLELVDRHTEPSTVWTGRKLGSARGWIGTCTVEVNAIGEWLLRVAECIGLGGKTAYGFGRIRVTGC